MKPTRQNMEEEATDEFLSGKCHGLLLTVVSIVLISEAHLTGLDVQPAVVRDGYAVGVAADVIQHLFGSGEGRLGIEDRKSTRLNSSHTNILFAVFSLK